jgi:ATP-dependent DNA helicase RecG
MTEGSQLDKKSIRVFATDPKKWPWSDLAKDCVAFANTRDGGVLLFGIEDNASEPSSLQRIPADLPDRFFKRITQLTTNTHTRTEICTHANGGQYLRVQVVPSSKSIAATTDGRYYLRIADESRPLLPEDMVRLVSEKDSYRWETQISRRIAADRVDLNKLHRFLRDIRASDRVKPSVSERSDAELLEHYFFVHDGYLTNLGVLWIGTRADRAQLLHAPVIQFLKFDTQHERVAKRTWDDYSLNPAELIEAVWTEIPDWRETTELPDGIFRKTIPHYDEVVVRELLANALVHRPYTTRGDIFINLHPDYLEIHNPGLFPLGITPNNILQKTVRRNDHLAQVFHDLKLMEREGTGYDRIYETQLSQAKAPPIPSEGSDSVVIRIERRILRPELINLLGTVNQQFSLKPRERIVLGLLAQNTSLTALEFSRLLQLEGEERLRVWLGSLLDKELVLQRGRTRGTEYFLNPEILRDARFQGATTLKKIAPHRLRALILEDLTTHAPDVHHATPRRDLHRRIGLEIPPAKLRSALNNLVSAGDIKTTGKRGMGGGYYLGQFPPLREIAPNNTQFIERAPEP